MKVLIFTSAFYKRPLMTRQCILSSINQTYKNFTHSINITIDEDSETKDYSLMFDDILKNDNRIIINHNANAHTHINNLTAITSVKKYFEYDLFIKMDNDDIYKSNYVKNIVDFFNNNNDIDIVSTKITTQLNGYDLYTVNYENLGDCADIEGDKYYMPMTYAFNRKALKIIVDLKPEDVPKMYLVDFNINLQKYNNIYDDFIWRSIWKKIGLKHKQVNNNDEIIWNIHGNNLTVSDWIRKK